jgi:hypothetical protein
VAAVWRLCFTFGIRSLFWMRLHLVLASAGELLFCFFMLRVVSASFPAPPGLSARPPNRPPAFSTI